MGAPLIGLVFGDRKPGSDNKASRLANDEVVLRGETWTGCVEVKLRQDGQLEVAVGEKPPLPPQGDGDDRRMDGPGRATMPTRVVVWRGSLDQLVEAAAGAPTPTAQALQAGLRREGLLAPSLEAQALATARQEAAQGHLRGPGAVATAAARADMEAAHAEGAHDGAPRDGCPECDHVAGRC